MAPKFKVTRQEIKLIFKIAKRAVALAEKDGFEYRINDALMDLGACHCNGCPLDLEKLPAFEDGDFGHDVFGIRRFLDRKTGKIPPDRFDPRCSLPEREA